MTNNYERLRNELKKYYAKELQVIQQNNVNFEQNLLEYLATFIRYLRDTYLLSVDTVNENNDIMLASLVTAVREYELYASCITNYFNINFDTNVATRKDETKTEEEITLLYNKEKQLHWNNFWEVTKLNIESWCDKFNEYSI